MVENPSEWNEAVRTIHFADSTCDREAAQDAVAVDQFPCTECTQRFSTRKGLLSHLRAAHSINTVMRYSAGADRKCQCCQTVYSLRTRLIAHLTDYRRPKCHDWVLQHGSRLSESVVQPLDAADRELRSVQRRAGRTNVLSTGPAVLTAGSCRMGAADF